MELQIQDGAGTGYTAKVDKQNRVHVHSVVETSEQEASSNGHSYNINTGTITLTSASESSVLYIKNNGNAPLHISTIGYLLGNSTGGTGDLTLDVYKGPTGGTLISDESAVAIEQNKNVTSSNVINVDVFKGAEGKTCTGGAHLYSSLLPSAARTYLVVTGNVSVGGGGSICIKITPQASNTSMGVQVFLALTEYNLT